ncbi:MAG: hypothetical protein ACYTHJ_22055 [Planctomycetota bacterium]|jgi:hypothetical protein
MIITAIQTASLATLNSQFAGGMLDGWLAQRPSGLENESTHYMIWLIAAVIIGLVSLPAFINPKRTHQD